MRCASPARRIKGDRNASASGLSRGGGVAVAVRGALRPELRHDLAAPAPADELWVSIPTRPADAPRASGRAYPSLFTEDEISSGIPSQANIDTDVIASTSSESPRLSEDPVPSTSSGQELCESF
ncbi:hypothetical protein MSG28_001537 [Choristoneura fumiferana]|uniref:Uncharacterized protein n=1 Tax=Choristoneura fumiferana TaxID=7141 RepID=A0ACC0KUA2_CHOFU|nr:hypothetical protein MSG28_001537 [Choristoneura fumiferana]